jgi:predicted DNA-binding transcriptional regulator AlpA
MDIVDGPLGSPDDLLTTGAVCACVGGISVMSLWRWHRDLGFPAPDLIIARRKFWRRGTIQGWIAAQADKTPRGSA